MKDKYYRGSLDEKYDLFCGILSGEEIPAATRYTGI